MSRSAVTLLAVAALAAALMSCRAQDADQFSNSDTGDASGAESRGSPERQPPTRVEVEVVTDRFTATDDSSSAATLNPVVDTASAPQLTPEVVVGEREWVELGEDRGFDGQSFADADRVGLVYEFVEPEECGSLQPEVYVDERALLSIIGADPSPECDAGGPWIEGLRQRVLALEPGLEMDIAVVQTLLAPRAEPTRLKVGVGQLLRPVPDAGEPVDARIVHHQELAGQIDDIRGDAQLFAELRTPLVGAWIAEDSGQLATRLDSEVADGTSAGEERALGEDEWSIGLTLHVPPDCEAPSVTTTRGTSGDLLVDVAAPSCPGPPETAVELVIAVPDPGTELRGIAVRREDPFAGLEEPSVLWAPPQGWTAARSCVEVGDDAALRPCPDG